MVREAILYETLGGQLTEAQLASDVVRHSGSRLNRPLPHGKPRLLSRAAAEWALKMLVRTGTSQAARPGA